MPQRNDKPVPRATEKAIFHEASNACPFCGDTTLAALQIHHIESRAHGGTNHRSNLILTCATCHDKIEAGDVTLSDILRAKANMRGPIRPPRQRRDDAPLPANVVHFRGENAGIVANQVRITAPRRLRPLPPADVLASDGDRRTYIKYLVERYQKFKAAEMRGAMKHAVIWNSIKNEFGCTWEYVPLSRFDDLANYLQRRIENTQLGRNLRAQGRRVYSTYTEYLDGHRY